MDLSGVQLNVTSASILSDVFTIEWGLRRLVFRECDLSDQVCQLCALHFSYLKIDFTRLDIEANASCFTDTQYPYLSLSRL